MAANSCLQGFMPKAAFYTHTRAVADIQNINFLMRPLFSAARLRKPSWQHRCLCSFRRDFTVCYISKHLGGLILEAASGYTSAIANGISLKKTTGGNSGWFVALFLHNNCRSSFILVHGNGETEHMPVLIILICSVKHGPHRLFHIWHMHVLFFNKLHQSIFLDSGSNKCIAHHDKFNNHRAFQFPRNGGGLKSLPARRQVTDIIRQFLMKHIWAFDS